MISSTHPFWSKEVGLLILHMGVPWILALRQGTFNTQLFIAAPGPAMQCVNM